MGRSAERTARLVVGDHGQPELIVAAIREQLAAAVDPVYRDGQRAFFQHEIDTWGVRAACLKRIASAAWKQVKPLPPNPRNRLCELLWQSGRIEEGILAVYLYEHLRNSCGECEFKLFERWIDRHVDNWATCDAIGTRLVAASIKNQPSLVSRLHGWACSDNRWKRRAAAVSLVFEARAGRCTTDILSLAKTLLTDSDDMVQKGVGWLLKDAYRAAPSAVCEFWESHAAGAPALVLRIASEKMPESLRLHFRSLRNRSLRGIVQNGC